MSTELVPSEASGGLLTIFGVPCGVEISLHFCPHFTWCSPCVCVCPNLLFLFLTVFVYLAALGLSRGTWDLHYIMWDLLLWCLGSAVVDHGLRCPTACRILGFPGGACNKEPPCNAGSKEHFLHCKTDS